MSRSYYTRIDFKPIHMFEGGFSLNPIDKIHIILIKHVGIKQILKIENVHEHLGVCEYVAHVILGCNNGYSARDALQDVAEKFRKEVPVLELSCWKLDDSEEAYISEEELSEGDNDEKKE